MGRDADSKLLRAALAPETTGRWFGKGKCVRFVTELPMVMFELVEMGII